MRVTAGREAGVGKVKAREARAEAAEGCG